MMKSTLIGGIAGGAGVISSKGANTIIKPFTDTPLSKVAGGVVAGGFAGGTIGAGVQMLDNAIEGRDLTTGVDSAIS
jgi:hypothetical protein